MITRREYLAQLAALGAAPFFAAMTSTTQQPLTRKIPSSGEVLPAIGVGTWQTFDVGTPAAEREPLRNVLTEMTKNGLRVIDSSPMYGQSENVVGEISEETGVNEKLFIATKVWTSGQDEGIRQMNNSFRLLKRNKMDLMQIHNLVDWQVHLKTLRKWKEDGKVKYIGLTHYTDSSHKTIMEIIRSNPVDFIQVNYNLLDRHAENELFPLAQELKVAVLVNRPFEEGALFQRVKGKPLPALAAQIDCTSWAQYFLKFILSHPAVTCAIPGTSKVTHLLDNLKACYGRLPDEKQRQKMVEAL